MKGFFNRREEEIDEYLEDEELDIINLDETSGWSKLEVAEEMAKQQAVNLMEEIGDELAIIDVVEEDIEIEKLNPYKAEEKSTYKAAEPEAGIRELEEVSEEDLELEELSGDDLEMETLQDEDIEIETLQDEDIEIETLQDEDIEIETLQDEDIEIEKLSDDDLEYLTDDDEEEEEDYEEEESPFVFFENLASFFSRWTLMDKVVAVTGVLVLAVAILTVGVYAGNRGVDRQIEAFAPVGEQLETVGVVGQDKLLAVADAKKAMLEAAKLETELNQEYEENELSSEVKVIMKMTSVQKDLKIKFVNKKTGKLVGNVPFEVKITDADDKSYNKIDEDMDGIIYLTQITPGNYSVSMVELADLEGYSFSTSAEKIKVKENIEYEKVDVSDEIKDQSEVDVSKEDTAQKTETEATLTDTVEWVESTKKESSSQETYTKVSKDTIADPALSASLNLDLSILRVMQQSVLASDVIIPLTGEDGEGIPITEDGGSDGEGNIGTSQSVSVDGVSLKPANALLQMGSNETVTLSAVIEPDTASNKNVTWTSSNGSVATVTEGVVTAKSAGNATITVTTEDGGYTATCTVEVTATDTTEEVTGVTLNKNTLELKVGGTETLVATVAPENATDKTINWNSDKTDVATVDSNGKITAVKEGTANITVTTQNGGKTATCTVKVTATDTTVKVTEVTLNKSTLELTVDGSETLTATVKPDDATNKEVTWSSSDAAVATVDNSGKVTAVKEGTATITATADGKTASCTVTVKAKDAAVAVTEVALNKTSLELKINGSETLTATVKPENATDKTVNWSSDKTDVATVDSNGKITAVKEGTANITVTTKDGSKTATCKVNVSKTYDAKNDTTTSLKDKSGNRIYVLVNGNYVEAKVADYYKYDTFYKKEKVSQYIYTGWQNLDGKTYYFDKNGNKVTGTQVIQGAQYNFNSDGTLNTGSGILGIDVSTWNGNIDWNKVKNSGVSYVIIRTGFRGSTQGSLVEDNKFRQNIQGATNAGIKVGVYFFSQAINEVEAVEEASMVLSQIKGYKITYPVFIDVEPSGGRADSLSSGDRTKVINAFCQTIQNGGYRAGIYANKTWLSQKMNVSALSGYKIWLAQYNSKVTYSGRYDMWQYSDKGTVSGISGKVDMNLSYLTY